MQSYAKSSLYLWPRSRACSGFAPGLFGGDLPVDTAAYTPPVYGQVGDESQAAEHGGWYLTYEDNFDGDALNSDLWVTSPHGLRNTEYWCDNMVRVEKRQLRHLRRIPGR